MLNNRVYTMDWEAQPTEFWVVQSAGGHSRVTVSKVDGTIQILSPQAVVLTAEEVEQMVAVLRRAYALSYAQRTVKGIK